MGPTLRLIGKRGWLTSRIFLDVGGVLCGQGPVQKGIGQGVKDRDPFTGFRNQKGVPGMRSEASRKVVTVLTVLACFGLVDSRAAFGQEYTVIDLGTLPGGSASQGRAINDSSQVVGICDSATLGEMRAFLWENNTMQNLGTLGGLLTESLGMNNLGQVVGSSFTAGGANHAFLWESGAMTDLGTLGGDSSMAYGINDSGQIVGMSKTPTDVVNYYAFLWEAGKMINLGTLPGGAGSTASDINNVGQVVGSSDVPGPESHACLWQGGTITDLGTLGGTQGWANAINEAGDVVGQSKDLNGHDHAFLWTPGGGMIDLGTFGGRYSSAHDINNYGQVVGSADMPGDNMRAFIYDSTNGMRDLNDLIPADSGWLLSGAVGINDKGEICGTGENNGQTRAFLLTPSAPCCLPFGLLPMLFLIAAVYLLSSNPWSNNHRP